MAATDAGAYLFATDLLAEGRQTVLDRLRDLGITVLLPAVAYHQARDVVPHPGKPNRIQYRTDGLYLRPDPTRWVDATMRPIVQDEPLLDAMEGLLADRGGFAIDAWTVFAHNSSLGLANPDAVMRTCFDDPLYSNLCPSSPVFGCYAVNLAAEVAARGIDVTAEALSAQTFGHGWHHERAFVPISSALDALLSVCFCASCVAGGEAAGVDVAALRAAVSRAAASLLDGADDVEPVLDVLAGLVDPDLIPYQAARSAAVTELAARVAAAVHDHGRTFSFMDLTGAVLGYGDGCPAGEPAASQAWRLAIDPAAVAQVADSYTILGYARDVERLATDVSSYVPLIGGCELRVILRPGFPDTTSAGHLAEKVAAARASGAARVDFYNYGMYPQRVLDWIRPALAD